jgi:hypothetical protein
MASEQNSANDTELKADGVAAHPALEKVQQVKEEIVSELKAGDGTALEAASSLNRLTSVLDEQVDQLKQQASKVFLASDTATQEDDLPRPLSAEVKDLEVRILDKVAEALAEKSDEVRQHSRDLAAKQLNDLDGFDR